jgi:uncharacterized protein YndB with AHSA1/START domain
MAEDLIAKASITIDATRADVWNALVDPATIKKYMFGADVTSDWREGRPITWKGEWQGRSFEDRGVILQLTPERTLRYSHFSPLSGLPDKPENYHTVTVELSDATPGTRVTLTQDNNPTEQAREHSEKNWTTMLGSLKRVVEA